MKIETKFNINDKVTQLIYSDRDDVFEITSIVIDEDGLSYLLSHGPSMYNEADLVITEDKL